MHSDTIETTGIGRLVFKWRSYLPLLVLALLVWGLASGYGTHDAMGWLIRSGLGLAGSGLALRIYAVGHAPPGTSGRHRSQHAALLNTFGIYSIVRHPLYVGNVLVWTGVSMASGWPLGAVISAAAAVAMFGVIVRHEDTFLSSRFGTAHEEWAEVTPAFFPRVSLWRTARRPFHLAKALASEYSTLHSIGLVALLFAALRHWQTDAGLPASRAWWVLLALNTATYLGIRVWRTTRKRER